LEPFYREDFSYDAKGLEKTRKESGVKPLLEEFTQGLSRLPDWQVATLETYLRTFTETKGIKAAVLIHPVRLAVSGKTSGPGLFELLHSMGQAGTIRRLERFLQQP
jgi:glutamyl/glutaminyl-tRNA synthetase